MRRSEIWDVPDGGKLSRVLVISPSDINSTYGACLVLKLLPADAPDTVLTIPLGGTANACAFAFNVTQLRAARFIPERGAVRIGSASAVEMARVENALRIVQGL